MNASREDTAVDVALGPEPLPILCKVLAICLYSLLSLAGIYGNSLICLIIWRFKRLRTPTNILILNLAIGDLLISLVCMPYSFWHVIIFDDQRWVFGAVACPLISFMQATAVFLSSWTLVVISFDRCVAILFVMSPWLRLTRHRAAVLVLATWLFSSLLALPFLIVNRLELVDDIHICKEDWTVLEATLNFELSKTYPTLLFALQYCVPLCVLVITYTFIGLRMWNSRVPGMEAVKGASSMKDRHESVKKLIPMILMVSALYAGCWLPLNLLMNIVIVYNEKILQDANIFYYWWLAHTIAMLHSVVNPVVYYKRNARFREGFRYFSRCLPFVHFEGLRLLSDATRRAHAVRIVNMVAYMPVAGKTADEEQSQTTRVLAETPQIHRLRRSIQTSPQQASIQ